MRMCNIYYYKTLIEDRYFSFPSYINDYVIVIIIIYTFNLINSIKSKRVYERLMNQTFSLGKNSYIQQMISNK